MNKEQTDIEILEIQKHLEVCMKLLGLDLSNESTKDTPQRIAKMWVNELCKNINNNNMEELDNKMKTFAIEDCSREMIIVKDIKFNSMCEHHFLPFSGTVDIGYIPKDRIAGLSKLPRVVKYFSKMPQLQEKLTRDIGKYLVELLDPKFLVVRAVAKHGCVMCRGAESDCSTDTIYEYNPNKNEGLYNKFIRRLNL